MSPLVAPIAAQFALTTRLFRNCLDGVSVTRGSWGHWHSWSITRPITSDSSRFCASRWACQP